MKLRYLATIANSNVDKLSKDNQLPVRLCNYVDVYKNDIITDDLEFMHATASQEELEKFQLRHGDVIITKDSEDKSDIGVPAFVEHPGKDLVCGYHLTMLRPNLKRVFPKFLYWSLLSKPVREAFSLAANGVTRYGMTLAAMKDIEIKLPDLSDQTKISDFLDRETQKLTKLLPLFGIVGDGRDATTGSIVFLLREHKTALITAAVTGQIDVDSYGKSGTPSATLDRIEEEMQG